MNHNQDATSYGTNAPNSIPSSADAEIQRLTKEVELKKQVRELENKKREDQFGEPINPYDLNQVAKLRKK